MTEPTSGEQSQRDDGWRLVLIAIAALLILALALVAFVWFGAWRLAETWEPGD